MSTLTKNYIAVSEGRMTKAEFLRQVRQGFPNVISPLNSYSDAIQILRTKGLLSEEVLRNCNSLNLPVESIDRGVRYELEAMGYCIGSDSICPGDYKKARATAIDKLTKNRLHYYHLLAGTQKTGDQSDQMQKVTLKEAAGSRDMSEFHSWSIDDYKVAYIVSMFEKEGIEKILKKAEKILKKADLYGLRATRTNVALYIIQCTPAALTMVVKAFIKLLDDDFRNPENSNEFLASYKHNKNFQAALTELKDKKRVEECIDSVNFKNTGNNEDPKVLQRLIDKLEEKNQKNKEKNTEKSKDKRDIERLLKTIQIQAIGFKQDGLSPKGALQAAFLKNADWNEKTKQKAIGYGFMDKNGNILVNEQTLLKEAITKRIVNILSEAATANLAQLSDEHASIQGVPAILNNLENIVTEVESFILKTQTKIQNAFDSIGDIRNEDGIPVGYKFVQPILDSFRKDLEPVLQKASLDNLKLPEAPEEDQIDIQTPEGNAELEIEPKQTMFTPKSPLAENKQPRKRYTR